MSILMVGVAAGNWASLGPDSPALAALGNPSVRVWSPARGGGGGLAFVQFPLLPRAPPLSPSSHYHVLLALYFIIHDDKYIITFVPIFTTHRMLRSKL